MSVSFLLMTARESQNPTGNKTDIKATGELRAHQPNLFAEEVWAPEAGRRRRTHPSYR